MVANRKCSDFVPRQLSINELIYLAPVCRHVRQHTHTLFSHDWSFLEGAKNHRHTLKAGKHSFPFSLDLDGALPSTVITPHASIVYKLRATVIRSAFSVNWIAQKLVTVTRAFAAEALEYNQTLEIENTWPGKIMYSIMVPHKAFAAGDEIPVLLKFSPIAKGVSVLRIESTVKEYTCVRWKNSVVHQDSRVVATATHVIRNGRAVDASVAVDPHPSQDSSPSRSSSFLHRGARSRPNSMEISSEAGHGPPASAGGSISRMAALSSAVLLAPGLARDDWRGDGSSQAATSRTSNTGIELGEQEIDTTIRISIPPHTAPTHTVGQCLSVKF